MASRIGFVVTLSMFLCLASCDQKIPPQQRPPAAVDDHGHDHDGGDHHDNDAHGHDDHASAGPHGGHIVELGHDHSHHAELTDDHSTDTVTVYLLDKELKATKTDQTSVTLVLTADGQSESFELSGDGSKFSASDARMLELLEADGAAGKIRATIDGKAINGSFTHHEHEAHEHGHDHDHDHDQHADDAHNE